jgi:hypothetical protein
MRHHDRRSAPGCQEKWPDRGIKRRSGTAGTPEAPRSPPMASRQPRRLLSSTPFQSSSGECRLKRRGTSQMCQEETLARLIDHLIGAREQHGRDLEAERLGSLEVDHQLQASRLLDWDVGRFRSM